MGNKFDGDIWLCVILHFLTKNNIYKIRILGEIFYGFTEDFHKKTKDMKNIELMLIILGFGCNTIIAQKIEKMDTAEAYIFSYFIYSGNAEDFSNNELYVLLLKNKNYIEEILSCNTKDYQYCEKSDILIKKIQKIIRKEAIGTLFFVPGLPYLSLMEYIGKYNDTEFITSFAQRKSVQELLIPGNQDDILNGNIVSGFTGYYPTLQTDTETSSKEIKIVQPKRSYIFKKKVFIINYLKSG